MTLQVVSIESMKEVKRMLWLTHYDMLCKKLVVIIREKCPGCYSFIDSTEATLLIVSLFTEDFLSFFSNKLISGNSSQYPAKIPLILLFSVFGFLLFFLDLSFKCFLLSPGT